MTRKRKKQKKHKQNFGTHPVPGQSCKFVYVYVFFLSLISGSGEQRKRTRWPPTDHSCPRSSWIGEGRTWAIAFRRSSYKSPLCSEFESFLPSKREKLLCTYQQKGIYPYPLGAGPARPNPKKGAPETENPLFIGFTVLRGGLGPWSQTMVSEGARPWGRGRSKFAVLRFA